MAGGTSAQPQAEAPTSAQPQATPAPMPPPPIPKPRMKKGEVANFLKLATSLKIYLSRSISDAAVERASKLYEEYICELEQVSMYVLIDKLLDLLYLKALWQGNL